MDRWVEGIQTSHLLVRLLSGLFVARNFHTQGGPCAIFMQTDFVRLRVKEMKDIQGLSTLT